MFDKAHNSRKKGNILNSQTCNVCRNELITYYSKVQDTITNEIFAIFKCTNCGLGHTLPQPKNLHKYYNRTYYGNRHGFTQNYCIKRRTKLVFWKLKDRDGKRLLDIGCGDGSFLRAIKESGWDVAGTEINPNLELTEELIVKANIDQLSNCAPFDCITMWHTLEHMRNIRSTLSQINSLLKPSGKLIIAVPNINSFQSKVFKSKWLSLDVPRHQYHFDVPSLQYCLRANGFVVQHQLYQEFEYDLLGWTQSALNCILPTPNLFFDILRRKPKIKRKKYYQLNMLLGIFFLLFFIPAVLIERLFNRSGTIIAIIIKDVK